MSFIRDMIYIQATKKLILIKPSFKLENIVASSLEPFTKKAGKTINRPIAIANANITEMPSGEKHSGSHSCDEGQNSAMSQLARIHSSLYISYYIYNKNKPSLDIFSGITPIYTGDFTT